MNFKSNSVSVIDTRARRVVATVPAGTQPTGVAVTPEGRLAYVTSYGDGSVSAIDSLSHKLVATIAVGIEPFAVAIKRQNPKCESA